jgi:hypothetical protein
MTSKEFYHRSVAPIRTNMTPYILLRKRTGNRRPPGRTHLKYMRQSDRLLTFAVKLQGLQVALFPSSVPNEINVKCV